jgi:cellulose synthase/poly-beta-1,6-N-acetylglucosamine synthase-like glycosyltransferase
MFFSVFSNNKKNTVSSAKSYAKLLLKIFKFLLLFLNILVFWKSLPTLNIYDIVAVFFSSIYLAYSLFRIFFSIMSIAFKKAAKTNKQKLQKTNTLLKNKVSTIKPSFKKISK